MMSKRRLEILLYFSIAPEMKIFENHYIEGAFSTTLAL